MTRILIVDDEQDIREVVNIYARKEGYDVDEAQNGKQALEAIHHNNYDVIILDIMMPELDGFSALHQMKEIKDIPVIMLSAKSSEEDKLHAFSMGVDDYVVKPFSPKELMARIKVILERRKPVHTGVMKFGGLEIDPDGRKVVVDGNVVAMTPKEIDLLLYLVRNKDVALSRQKLLKQVWNYEYFGEDRTVDTHIKMLRRDLGPYRDCIVTVRGMGYKFEA